MKSVIALAAMVLGMGFNANAVMPDQMSVVLKCTRAMPVPDIGLSVEVEVGGIAGLTQLHVSRSYLGKVFVKNYIVKQVLPKPGLLGAPVVYEGQEARLTVNFTTAPDKNGGHIGTFETNDGSGVDEKLSCQALMTAN